MEGSTDQNHYGLQLAKEAGLPIELLENAKRISYQLSNDQANNLNGTSSYMYKLAIRRKAILTVCF